MTRGGRTRQAIGLLAGMTALTLGATACSSASGQDAIAISGSSTVAPITRAVAAAGGYAVNVAAEGTTDGFERFCSGETAINNASTSIPGAGQPTDYVQLCADNGVEFIELPIALDALTVVRNEANGFATDLTLDELRAVWAPESQVRTWADVRPEWPAEPIGLYGRGEGSGTFASFTHAVVGEAGTIRADYAATDDLDELARWIAEDPNGLGFMGVGNYLATDEDARDRITNVNVNGVGPGLAEVQAGRYAPLTRPLFVYVSLAALDDDDVTGLVEYYLANVVNVLPRVYFYALPGEAYPLVAQRFAERVTGTAFGGDPFAGVSVLDALTAG